MDKPCPNCGYCPCCGRRRGWQTPPPYQPPYAPQPWWQAPPLTPYVGDPVPGITITTSTNTASGDPIGESV